MPRASIAFRAQMGEGCARRHVDARHLPEGTARQGLRIAGRDREQLRRRPYAVGHVAHVRGDFSLSAAGTPDQQKHGYVFEVSAHADRRSTPCRRRHGAFRTRPRPPIRHGYGIEPMPRDASIASACRPRVPRRRNGNVGDRCRLGCTVPASAPARRRYVAVVLGDDRRARSRDRRPARGADQGRRQDRAECAGTPITASAPERIASRRWIRRAPRTSSADQRDHPGRLLILRTLTVGPTGASTCAKTAAASSRRRRHAAGSCARR